MGPTTVRWLVFGVGALVLLFFAARNAAQVWLLLKRLIPAGRAGDHVGEAVALTGEFHLIEAVQLGQIPCAFYQCRTQELSSSYGRNRSRSWRTVAERSDCATFGVKDGGEVVMVVDQPSEVHGLKTRTSPPHAGFFGSMFGGSSSREIERWLPLPQQVTVVGRLREEGTVVLGKDPKVGLLVSPRPARDVAMQEGLKAFLFLASIGALYWVVFYVPL